MRRTLRRDLCAVVVMGDWNAKIGKDSTRRQEVMWAKILRNKQSKFYKNCYNSLKRWSTKYSVKREVGSGHGFRLMDKLETYLSTSHATEIIVQWHLENAAASRVQMLADRPLLGACCWAKRRSAGCAVAAGPVAGLVLSLFSNLNSGSLQPSIVTRVDSAKRHGTFVSPFWLSFPCWVITSRNAHTSLISLLCQTLF